MFVVLVPLAIWIYTLVFAFASLWFAHYALAALERMRQPPLDVVSANARFATRPQSAPAPAPAALPPAAPGRPIE